MKPSVEPLLPELLLESRHREGAQGGDGDGALDGVRRGRAPGEVERPGILATGDGEERAHRGPAGESARDLPRPENRRLIRRDDAVGVRPSRRRSPDAPRVEVARAQPLHELATFREEGAALLEDFLERGQVHHRGVRLDLSEVRVDGGVERQARTETDLEVRPHAGLAPRHHARHGTARGRAQIARHVGQKLDPPAPPYALESGEVAEARRPPRLAPHDEFPQEVLLDVGHVAVDVHAPRRLVAVEAQLRERHAHLGRPPERVALHARRPHGIPRVVAVRHVVLGVVPVRAAARRVYPEGDRRAPVQVGVERDEQALGTGVLVAACAVGLDAGGVVRVHTPGDPQRVVVERERDFGPPRGRLALVRLALPERRREFRPRPHRVVQMAIQQESPIRVARGPELLPVLRTQALRAERRGRGEQDQDDGGDGRRNAARAVSAQGRHPSG